MQIIDGQEQFVTELAEGLWTFPIELPNNPLKWLNCYVIKGANGGRNLLVDTGFAKPECRAALIRGMDSLQLKPAETDVFITHFHTDHVGNAQFLYERGCRIIMGRIDYERFCINDKNRWTEGRERAIREGMPPEIAWQVFEKSQSLLPGKGAFTVQTVENGDILRYNDYELECVLTPGHTPGHMCLYDRRSKTMFLGDHVLFDISPNICAWASMKDSLGEYLDSLRMIKSYDVSLALPGHRRLSEISVAERAQQLLEHHQRRLDSTLEIIRANPGFTAYEIAGHMHWHITADSWEHFPLSQQYFAHSETIAHLAYLALRGYIRREESANQSPKYYACEGFLC